MKSLMLFLMKFVLLGLSIMGKETLALMVDKLSIAPCLPARGEEIRVRVILSNKGPTEKEDIKVRLSILREKEVVYRSEAKIDRVSPGEERRLEIGRWRANANGFFEASLLVEDGKERKNTSLVFPVVERKVHCAWYGTPSQASSPWATISTTIKEEEIKDWLWEGRLPLVFKPGVCFWERHKDSPVEEQVKCWENIPQGALGIGIDEWGASEAGEKVIEAIKIFKKAHPELRIALWTVGGYERYQELYPFVDFFLPECYLNYHNMHLGVLEEHIKNIKRVKAVDKTLIGLGINYKEGTGTLLTTPEELEEQFKLIKSLLPDAPGIAFFYAGSVPELDKVGDSLFFRYFVLPVIRGELEIDKDGKTVKVVLENIGNMDAKGTKVSILEGGRKMGEKIISEIKVGEKIVIPFSLTKLGKGFHQLKLELEGMDVTFLDSIEKIIAVDVPYHMQGGRVLLYLPPCPYNRHNQPIHFSLPQSGSSVKVLELAGDGEILREIPSQVDGKGRVHWVVEHIPAGEERFYAVYEHSRGSSTLSKSNLTSTSELKIENAFYELYLNLEKDEITRLIPKGTSQNLLSSPWRMECRGYGGFKTATIEEGQVFTLVTIPFENDLAEGESRYLFYKNSPIIAIEREFRPRKPLEIEGAREGGGFYQEGGFFQAYPGEGSLRMNKGRLVDSSEYRDIYFGYLGGPPSPENFAKTGWLDFCWEKGPGLGISIVERWREARSRTYDVTRYYDGGDWVDIFYVFQTKSTIAHPQTSRILLLPHGSHDLEKGNAPILPFHWTERNPLAILRESSRLPKTHRGGIK